MATSKKRTSKSGKKNNVAKQPQVTVEPPEEPVEPQEELQKDVLDDFLFHAANYIYVRRKLFITLAIAVAVIILSVYGAIRFVQYRENLRNKELYAIEKIISNPGLNADQRVGKAMPMLDRFLEEYANTQQAILAQLHRGGLHYSTDSYAEAEADYEAVRSVQEKNSELYILASIYLSNVLRDQKKLDRAIEVLQSAQSGKMTDVLLMEMAELYSQSGQQEKAKETLNILLKDYPKSPYSQRASQMLKLL